MTFSSPQWLLLLVLLPAVAAIYVVHARKRTRTRPLAEPALVPGLVPRAPGWRQHVPAASFGVAAAAGLVAFAGPTATVADRHDAATVVIAMDVSGSMDQTDVAPDRLTAARTAADRFVAGLPDHTEVGIVQFAASASVLLPPTPDHEEARRVLATLRTERATAIGEAVHTSVDLLAGLPPTPRRIVLLSDGSNTAGRSVEGAAQAAAAAGIPVDTIAFGTGTAVAADPRAAVDREALQALAQTSGGRAYEAASVDDLEHAYEEIGSETVVEPVRRPIADWLLGAALLAALAGAAVALTWFRRLPA